MSENLTLKKATVWKGLCLILVILLAISIYSGGFGRSSKTEVDMTSFMDDDTIKGDPSCDNS